MLLDSVEDKKDLWLIYELCPGRTMNEHLFTVKGEFYKGERIYMVHHGSLYHAMRSDTNLLRDFLFRMCSALSLFQRLGIVHADLKPDNILIDYDHDAGEIKSLKLIDLGSSFLLNPEGFSVESQSEFGSSTPEYLPPEIHQFLARRYTQERNVKVEDFNEISYIFDMWSLGSILMEVLTGFPLWLSLKSRVLTLEGRSIINYGLFGVAGRDNMKILNKQNQVLGQGLPSLIATLKKGFDYSGQTWTQEKTFSNVLTQMLCMSPFHRLSPDALMDHPFMQYV